MTYLAPSIQAKDAPAFLLGAEILAGGVSSRLYQALVYGSKSHGGGFGADLHEDLGLLIFRLVLASGKSIAQAEKALKEQIDKVLKEGVTKPSWTRQRIVSYGQLLERETANGKASALGEAAVIYGDASA